MLHALCPVLFNPFHTLVIKYQKHEEHSNRFSPVDGLPDASILHHIEERSLKQDF
jgi:hypothetical protein